MFRYLHLTLCSLLLLPVTLQAAEEPEAPPAAPSAEAAPAAKKRKGVPKGTDLSRLNQGNQERSYRRRVFRAYVPLEDMWKKLHVGQYSSLENPTGLYFKGGERITITVENEPEPDSKLQFIIFDYGRNGRSSNYPLKPGENEFTAGHRGLGYLDYRHPSGGEAKPLTVSLKGGVINGVFSRHDSTQTWKRLLANTKADFFDMVGERCQVVFTVDALRRGTRDKGVEMLKLYDKIVENQQKLMGWDQQGIHPGNHIMCRVMWKGYMHADGLGAAFHVSTLPGISDPEGLREGSWGVAHELGHNNQIHPGFCWVGTTEVTNNLFSMWCSYKIGAKWLRLEHEESPTADGQWMRGAVFDRYINRGVVQHRVWQCHQPGDPFVTLCPLWQLLLYFHLAQGQDDFYPEVFRLIREHNNEPMTYGQARINFCRYVSEAAKRDMSEFMLRTGMLGPINRELEDYANARISVSPDMIRDTIRRASRYPEPDSPVIYYINACNVDIFRQRAKVEPSPSFSVQLPEAGQKKAKNIVIPADTWKNAVAFESYKEGKLIHVSLRGLGQQDDASTTVICPPGTTELKAVQWDGERFTVSARPTGDQQR